MKRFFIYVFFSCIPVFSFAAVTLNPSITPALFRYNDRITVTYDVTGTSLASLTSAWVWVWIPGASIDAKYNINPATAAATPAMCTRSVANGKTLFSISFVPSDFFSSDISAQARMGILLKGADWSNGQTTDYLANFLTGNNFQATLTSPSVQPLFVHDDQSVQVQASASAPAKFYLWINNKKIDSVSSAQNYSRVLIADDSLEFYTCSLTATSEGTTVTMPFSYLFSGASPVAPRPPGIIDGINYHADQTKATLCFWAPGKTSVYAFGDFTDWNVDPKYRMKKDGEHFWVEINGLTPGAEYAFQYLVNDSLRIADPYTDKILEQDDNLIPATTYPNLKTIPARALSSQWYFNHFSILQTAQVPYVWQTTNYQKPAKEKLVIYELLIRDFFDSDHRNFQALIDTISYFKKLGVNAIELMPVAEFNGAIGWGYNPTSMFAVQKYYGTKNKLKEFVDKCHANGIAVILDLVMNHQDLPNAYALLDYDFANGRPKAGNKWFNVSPKHPYNVFNDMNHASPYTQKYLDTINYYWINEFKIDGYRYDLSKGFTQINSGDDVNKWGQYDQSRIDILTRMADALWAKFPDAYIILEHFAVNAEETVLANYRANEGKGMMLWGNFNGAYSQNAMGYSSGADLSDMYYGNKGWTSPRLVSFMESHDEERVMYRNLQNGNASGSYSVKNLATALERMKAAALMFYTIPGPKMLWEFGELGYDQSINRCNDGTVNSNCRLDPKPVLWSYRNDENRQSLFNHVADLIRLRKNYPLFSSTGTVQLGGSTVLAQQMTLKNSPYTDTPSDSSRMNAQVVANFDVISKTIDVTFPHAGTWYDYYGNGATLNVASASMSMTLMPGDYRLFTDVRINAPGVITAVEENFQSGVALYPNPVHTRLYVESGAEVSQVMARTISGALLPLDRIDENAWDVSPLSPGLYIVEINTRKGIIRKKIIRK